jgi:hypothetical protein
MPFGSCAYISRNTATRGRCHPGYADKHAVYSGRQLERSGSLKRSRRSGSRITRAVMIQEVLRGLQALGLVRIVRVLFGRLRRRGMVPESETRTPETRHERTPETRRLTSWEWLLLVAARRLAKSILVEALQLPRLPRRFPPSDASRGRGDASGPMRALTMASHSWARSPWLRWRRSLKTAVPSLRQRLILPWSPVGPRGFPCAGFNQPLLLEMPLLWSRA